METLGLYSCAATGVAGTISSVTGVATGTSGATSSATGAATGVATGASPSSARLVPSTSAGNSPLGTVLFAKYALSNVTVKDMTPNLRSDRKSTRLNSRH